MVQPNNCSHTAPVNIDYSQQSNICSSVCNYKPIYTTTGGLCSTVCDHIKITLTSANNKIMFNSIQYQVSEIRIYNKALHKYGGSSGNSIGEMLIIHKSINQEDANLLIISIPLIVSTMENAGTETLETIIKTLAPFAGQDTLSTCNSKGDEDSSQQYTLPSLNITNLISKIGFYYYKGVFTFQKSITGNCNASDIIVYPSPEGAINITEESKTKLHELIRYPSHKDYSISDTATISYNQDGFSKDIEDDIYIDCQPVNSSGEVYIPLTDKKDESINALFSQLNNFGNNDFLNAIIGVVAIFSLFMFAQTVFGSMNYRNALKDIN